MRDRSVTLIRSHSYMYGFDISRDPKLLCTTQILFLDYLLKADYLRWSSTPPYI
eukprot:SAG11_NODE_1225_length_5476_cov_7.465129_5_plen_54_part_00